MRFGANSASGGRQTIAFEPVIENDPAENGITTASPLVIAILPAPWALRSCLLKTNRLKQHSGGSVFIKKPLTSILKYARSAQTIVTSAWQRSRGNRRRMDFCADGITRRKSAFPWIPMFSTFWKNGKGCFTQGKAQTFAATSLSGYLLHYIFLMNWIFGNVFLPICPSAQLPAKISMTR